MASCSSVEMPGFFALPPRFLGARPTSLRDPLADFRMKVSSASTMPVSADGRLSLAAARKRWRQRNEVSRHTSARSAALRGTRLNRPSRGHSRPRHPGGAIGQRRAGQGIEGAAAVLAFVAPEAARLPPRSEALGLAVAAGRRCCKPHLDQRDRLVGRALAGQCCRQRRALHLRQITQLLDKNPEDPAPSWWPLPRRESQCRVSSYIKAKQSHIGSNTCAIVSATNVAPAKKCGSR